MAEEDASEQQTTQFCSVSLFTNTPCREICDLVYLKDCNKSISSHLLSLNISYDEKHLSEGLLICSRIGIFTLVPYFTVCPYHRSSLGLNWKKKASCVYPSHSGKGKGDRPLSYRTSYALVSRGILLPVGSCMFFKKKLSLKKKEALKHNLKSIHVCIFKCFLQLYIIGNFF